MAAQEGLKGMTLKLKLLFGWNSALVHTDNSENKLLKSFSDKWNIVLLYYTFFLDIFLYCN